MTAKQNHQDFVRPSEPLEMIGALVLYEPDWDESIDIKVAKGGLYEAIIEHVIEGSWQMPEVGSHRFGKVRLTVEWLEEGGEDD